MIENLTADIAALTPDLVAWRRDFHRHPEIAFQEHRTSGVLKEFFQGLGMEVRVLAGTGLAATLHGRPGGRTIALRADIDALPLTEEGKDEFASQNPGACHACGHDGHMAILMGTARMLAKRAKDFTGKVVFLLQPSEECFPGGALPMIEGGALDGVDAIYGLHLWQTMPTGVVGSVSGEMMAAADEFIITLIGRGGHGSMPHLSLDPISAMAHLIANLNTIVSRNVDPLLPAVLSYGTIEGGTIYNIIPNQVRLTGTVRTFDAPLRGIMESRIREVVDGTCMAFGVKSEIEYILGYPALINDATHARFVLDVAREVLGSDQVVDMRPVMGGEDFAYYLQHVPGAFFFVGMGDGMPYPHHHPRFDLDERALPKATLLMTALALKALDEGVK